MDFVITDDLTLIVEDTTFRVRLRDEEERLSLDQASVLATLLWTLTKERRAR